MHVIINLLPVKGVPIRRALGASGIGSVPDEVGNPARLSVVGQIVVSFPFSIFSQAMSSPCMSPCRPCMSSPSRSSCVSLPRSLSAFSSLVLFQAIMVSTKFLAVAWLTQFSTKHTAFSAPFVPPCSAL